MGVLLALTGALAFSFMNVFIRRGVRPGDPDNGVLTTMLVNVAIFGILLAAVAAGGGVDELSPEAFAWFVAAGLSATFLGRYALFAGIRRLGAARAAAIKNATPLVTVIIALLFLGERLTLVDGAGVALILVGLFTLIAESLQGAPDPLRGEAVPDPVTGAFESEALAESGRWDRTRELAGRAVAHILAPSRRRVLLGVSFAALAALFFGTGHALRKVGMDLEPNAVLGAMIGSSTALTTYLVAAAIRGEAGFMVRSSLTTLRPYFWAAGLAGTVGQLSFFAALAFAPVSHVSVVAGSETVLTVLLAALLAARLEAITRRVVLPAVLVFLGTALIGIAGS